MMMAVQVTTLQVEVLLNFPDGVASSNITSGSVNNCSDRVHNIDPTSKRKKHVSQYFNRAINSNGSSKYIDYWDIGDPSHSCRYCGALFWCGERLTTSSKKNPVYSGCCGRDGKIQLPKLNNPPQSLQLLHGDNEKSKHFRDNIRSYNSMFSFTSNGAKIDTSINQGKSPPIIKMQGQNYHLMGSLLPPDGETPKFAQLYIYDTENEVANRINAVRKNHDSNGLHSEIVHELQTMLDKNNVLVKSFRMAKDRVLDDRSSNIKLKLIGKRGTDGRTHNLPSVSEVAALIVGDFDRVDGDRDILVETRSGKLDRINELNAAYLALQYPLLFPYGEDGYREDIEFAEGKACEGGRKNISQREFFACRMHDRDDEATTLLHSRKLFQQFLVDAFTTVESARTRWVRQNQPQLRAQMYKGLQDAYMRGETNASAQGKRIILPSSFTVGPRNMIQNYQDAMAICRWAGYPDLFITFTCNAKWPEITRFLEKRKLKPEDRPDIVCRVFKMKLDELMNDIQRKNIFGEVKAVVYAVEFQKRGLPHAHILVFLCKKDGSATVTTIDDVISAEIPDQNSEPEYHASVIEYMMHGPCGAGNKSAPCMVDGKCTKYFPKNFIEQTTIDEEGYPTYRRRDDGRFVLKNGVPLDNRYVVPHNRYLLLKYGAHLNVEWCNQSRAIKYLFKYINKGNDHVTATFYKSSPNVNSVEDIDEVKQYYECRYVSSCEAAWRLLGFELHYRDPPVERLSFHLPDEQNVVFSDQDEISTVLAKPTAKQSQFLAWFQANDRYPWANNLTYEEFPQHFVWIQKEQVWKPRRRKRIVIGRVIFVPPGCGDMYYLRLMINVVRGAKCYKDLMKVNGIQYDTLRDACYVMGLLTDDKEYIDGIVESSQFASAHSMRLLFATLLSSNCISRPEHVWEACWVYLSEDVLDKQRKLARQRDLRLSEEDIKNYALVEIDKLLQAGGKSLKDFHPMPIPASRYFNGSSNRLVLDELRYDPIALSLEHENLLRSMNVDQRHVYDVIMSSINDNKGGVFFIYGYGGTGKTFVWKTLSSCLRSQGEIVLNVASSGIASLLLPGGRTAHSRFSIPFEINGESTCNIKLGSPLSELLMKTKLIIWDEAPMMHRHCFEALDTSLKDIMKNIDPANQTKPFGGKIVVFGGDFRQILPVIPKARRPEIVGAAINSSPLWKHCKVLRLTKNMRLQNTSSLQEMEDLQKFSEWIANIGDGTIGEHDEEGITIDIPHEFLIHDFEDPIPAIVESTYPSSGIYTGDSSYFKERAILAPTLDVVDEVNQYMNAQLAGDGRLYLSSDEPCHSNSTTDVINALHTTEFLNEIRSSGVPNHELNLKVGTPVMLLRNVDHSIGLCNGTRMVVTRLGNHVIEAEILTGSNAGHRALIPRMSLTPSDPRLPVKFTRRQYPLIVSFAMTINKSQGQSLAHVGLFLRKPVFCHGQLYVALSRVTHPKGLRILICDQKNNKSATTRNVVYKEVFRNL
ncbi:hypothetical protein OROMI_028477 [Orobanche minor]